MKFINKIIKNKNGFPSLLKGSGSTFIIKLSALGIAFILQVILARTMGVDSFGIYVFVMTWLQFLLIPSLLGFDTSTLRLVSSYKAQLKLKELNGFLKISNRIVLLLSISIAIVALIVIIMQTNLAAELRITWFISLIVLPFMSLATLREKALQSLKYFLQALLPEKILRPFLLILFVMVLSFTQKDLNAPLVMSLYLLATIITFLIGAWLLKRKTDKNLISTNQTYLTKQWLKISFPLMFVSGMYLLLGQVDILMIGLFINTDQVGIYSIAVRLASLISIGLQVLNIVSAPTMSELYALNKPKELSRVCWRTSLIGTVISIILVMMLIICGEFILGLFGLDFKQGIMALLILSFSQLINAMFGQTGTLMTMTGQQKALGNILVLAVILNIVLNTIFIPLWGINGAAIATLISSAIWNLLIVVFARKKHGFDPSILGFINSYFK